MKRPVYATLDDLQMELSQVNSVNPLDASAALLDPVHGMQLLETVSQRVDDILTADHRSFFGPVKELRKVRLTDFNYSNTYGWLNLSYPIVELDETTFGETEVDTLEIQERQQLYLSDSSWYNLQACSSRNARLNLNSWWGWAVDPEEPWTEVGELTDDLDDVMLTLPVDPALRFGLTQGYAFSPGRVLKVNDELMVVVARILDPEDSTQSYIKVLRGALGTVAQDDHAEGDTVSIWQHPASLSREVARQAAMLYVRRGAFQAEMVDGVGLTTYPQDLLTSLHSVLTEFQR